MTISVYLPLGQVFVNHRWPPAADKPRWTEPPWEAAVRGDLNRRLVQWLRLWRATLTGGKTDLQCGRRQAFAVGMNCACFEPFVRRCMAPLPHPTPTRRCAPVKRWQQTQHPRHGGPRPWGCTVAHGSGKRWRPASDFTTAKRPFVQHGHCCASKRATRLRNPVAA
jgi:hypothetical protein